MPVTARLFKFWDYPDLRWQTPGRTGRWRGVRYLFDDSGPADYTIIHGHAGNMRWTFGPRNNVWLLMGEPPNEAFGGWHDAAWPIQRIYTTDAARQSRRHVLSAPGLPWHVGRDFDFLEALPPLPKERDLSWITSSRADTDGHRHRLAFLERLRKGPRFDLFGRGFEEIADKWDGLAPYRYSIAFENFSNAHYWTEKVMDCFLAWTMPIYYGCTELERFFPAESFVRIDPDAPDVVGQVQDIITSNRREEHLPAVAEARRRVLYDHNLFEFLTREIERAEASRPAASRVRVPIVVRDHTLSLSRCVKLEVRRRLGLP